ncbi:plasmid replication protein RepC [Sulfitobacter sp.]|uniref:plasmid replication protein RepC n=1 Tax=Sulfitobacter sp. TaxID=1903071 RepID=UPI00261CBD71|nr:plasmid replication protein RepC [Sulfitobacter sp.]
MEQAKTTAFHAGGRSSFAPTLSGTRPSVTRRALITAVKESSQSYGLSPSSILVLDTLLSFLPSRDRETGTENSLSSDDLLVVYPSNKSICERANRMSDRVLRRHIAKLCEIGFITRKDSATGKRFPLRVGGVVRDAFGFDLSPLLRIYPELVAEAAKLELEASKLRSMRSKALAIRADLLRAPEQLTEAQIEYLTKVKKILRRTSLTPEGVAVLIREMRALKDDTQTRRSASGETNQTSEFHHSAPSPTPATADLPQCTDSKEIALQEPERYTNCARHDRNLEIGAPRSVPLSCRKVEAKRATPARGRIADTPKESARDGQNSRQVESIKIDPNKKVHDEYKRLVEIWKRCPNIASLYPEAIQSPSRLREAIFLFGSFLSLKSDTLAKGVALIGWPNMLSALEYLAKNAMRIKSPSAYFHSMITGFVAGRPVAGIR